MHPCSNSIGSANIPRMRILQTEEASVGLLIAKQRYGKSLRSKRHYEGLKGALRELGFLQSEARAIPEVPYVRVAEGHSLSAKGLRTKRLNGTKGPH